MNIISNPQHQRDQYLHGRRGCKMVLQAAVLTIIVAATCLQAAIAATAMAMATNVVPKAIASPTEVNYEMRISGNSNPTTGEISDIYVYVGGKGSYLRGGKVLRSTNYGATWEDLQGDAALRSTDISNILAGKNQDGKSFLYVLGNKFLDKHIVIEYNDATKWRDYRIHGNNCDADAAAYDITSATYKNTVTNSLYVVGTCSSSSTAMMFRCDNAGDCKERWARETQVNGEKEVLIGMRATQGVDGKLYHAIAVGDNGGSGTGSVIYLYNKGSNKWEREDFAFGKKIIFNTVWAAAHHNGNMTAAFVTASKEERKRHAYTIFQHIGGTGDKWQEVAPPVAPNDILFVKGIWGAYNKEGIISELFAVGAAGPNPDKDNGRPVLFTFKNNAWVKVDVPTITGRGSFHGIWGAFDESGKVTHLYIVGREIKDDGSSMLFALHRTGDGKWENVRLPSPK
jgi:hypothetical protein